MKRALTNVTLLAVSGLEIEAHIKALEYSCKGIDFGKILLLAPFNPYPDSTSYEYIRISTHPLVAPTTRDCIFDQRQWYGWMALGS